MSRIWPHNGRKHALRRLVLIASLLSNTALIIATADGHAHSGQFGRNFGVAHVRVFAKVPVQDEASGSRIMALNLWLKVVTPDPSLQQQQQDPGLAGQGSSEQQHPRYMLPTQTLALEGFGWVEDVYKVNNSRYGHLLMTINIDSWRPKLLLETAADETPVVAVHHHPCTILEPFAFTFHLSEAQLAGRCFKVYEETMPDYRAPICPPASSLALCNTLAPPSRFTPSRPALWAALLPFRSMGVPGPGWQRHMVRSAARIRNYVEALLAVGGTGALVYADRFMAEGLGPHLADLLADGTVVMVAWEHIDRMQYNYDQVVVYAHALLGLAGCGANIWVMTADVDELLYNPYGRSWPDMFACIAQCAAESAAHDVAVDAAAAAGRPLAPTAAAPPVPRADEAFLLGRYGPGVVQFNRVDVMASKAKWAQEVEWWATTTTIMGDGVTAGGGGSTHRLRGGASEGTGDGAVGFVRHPIETIDRMAKKPYNLLVGKYIALPARRTVAVFVHDAQPLYGRRVWANATCAIFLHVVNFWEQRTAVGPQKVFDPFRVYMTIGNQQKVGRTP